MRFYVDVHLDFYTRIDMFWMCSSYVFLQDLEIGIIEPAVWTIEYSHSFPP